MEFIRAAEQPTSVEIRTVDGVFIKRMRIQQAGTYIPQHSHKYDHTSWIAKGRVRVWRDDVLWRDYVAPHSIYIEAGVKHRFLALEDDTIVDCIHNISRTGEVEILEEHQLIGGE